MSTPVLAAFLAGTAYGSIISAVAVFVFGCIYINEQVRVAVKVVIDTVLKSSWLVHLLIFTVMVAILLWYKNIPVITLVHYILVTGLFGSLLASICICVYWLVLFICKLFYSICKNGIDKFNQRCLQRKYCALAQAIRTATGSYQLFGNKDKLTVKNMKIVKVKFQELLLLLTKSNKEIEPILRMMLMLFETICSTRNKDTLIYMNMLGVNLVMQGKLLQAEPIINRSVICHEQFYGGSHPKTLISLHNVGWLYMQQKKPANAEKFLRYVVHKEEILYGLNHPSVLNTIGWLQQCLKQQGKTDEAEALLARVDLAKINHEFDTAQSIQVQMHKHTEYFLNVQEHHRTKHAIQIQSLFKRYVARKEVRVKMNQKVAAALTIQFNYRGFIRDKTSKILAALVKIQSNYRGFVTRKSKVDTEWLKLE
jgi:hypothetical protein